MEEINVAKQSKKIVTVELKHRWRQTGGQKYRSLSGRKVGGRNLHWTEGNEEAEGKRAAFSATCFYK